MSNEAGRCEALVIEDGVERQCERPCFGQRRWCSAHRQRLAKGIESLAPIGARRGRHANGTPEVVGYFSMHRRLTAAFGRASEYDCAACGRQAAQWALVPDIGPHTDAHGRYSLDPADYEPRCMPCHVARDRPIARAARLHPSAR